MPHPRPADRREAEAQIVELLTRDARAVDAKDEVMMRSCFADQVGYDAKSVGPMQPLFERRAPGMSADEFAASIIANMRSKGATQHLITNPQIEFSDEHHAHVTASLRAIHFALDRPTAAPYEIGAYYRHDVVAAEEEWRIAFWRIDITWEFGDFSVMYSPASVPPG